MGDTRKTEKNQERIRISEYSVIRNYGKTSVDDCLLNIVRCKISQVLQQHEKTIT